MTQETSTPSYVLQPGMASCKEWRVAPTIEHGVQNRELQPELGEGKNQIVGDSRCCSRLNPRTQIMTACSSCDS